MKTTNQFWALCKYQASTNPFIWIMPLAFSAPLLLPLMTNVFSKDFHSSFSLLLSNQNMFFVAFVGAMILAPEKFQFGPSNLVTTYYGNEFILTRAIDRPVLFRAKAATLYFLILALPCLCVVNSARNPDLVVSESSRNVQQACLSQVPGSTLQHAKWDKHDHPSLIAIPRGSVMVAEWQVWIFVVAAVLLQLSIFILYPFKYAKFVYWTFFFVLVLVPLFDLTSLRSDLPTINDRLFFSFASNPFLFWGSTALVFILSQLWCERRFSQLEQ